MPKTTVKFLLVDDLEGNLLALNGLLRREGLELLNAHSGPEALELLLANEVALALIDVQMPGMDGFELAELMRGTERTRRVPIIFVTAGAVDAQRRFRGYETGAVDFLFKPIEPHILRSKAEVFFQLACQREELRAAADENARLLADSRRNEEEIRKMRDRLAESNLELERKVQERTTELQETVTELEHFSYAITHDMRAPLRAMQSFAHLMLEQECADCLKVEPKEFLQRIAIAAARMDHLITDALQFSRALRAEYPLQPIDLAALLEGLIVSYPNLQPPAVEISVEGDIPAVLGNEAGLTQCFSNLLGNAVKFVAPAVKPKVRIWAEEVVHAEPSKPQGNALAETPIPFVRVWVEDNGIGIAKDYQEKIFQIFQQLNRKYEGTGIGLAVVRRAVSRMEGKVGVISDAGQGSRFWVELKKAV